MTPVVVTGVDLPEGRKADSAPVGLSVAVTYASRASREGRAGSFYVRDLDGELVGRADADGGGSVLVYGEATIRSYHARHIPLPEIPDRAPTSDAAAVSLVGGRPGTYPATLGKETEMATEKKTRTSRAKAASSGSRSSAKKKADAKVVEASAPAATPADEMADAVKRVSAKQAAVQVLREASEPLKIDEIVKRVLDTKGVQLGGQTPAATIAAMLAVENKKPDGLFVRTEKATYKLREEQQVAAA